MTKAPVAWLEQVTEMISKGQLTEQWWVEAWNQIDALGATVEAVDASDRLVKAWRTQSRLSPAPDPWLSRPEAHMTPRLADFILAGPEPLVEVARASLEKGGAP
jgi:hypothetical protein